MLLTAAMLFVEIYNDETPYEHLVVLAIKLLSRNEDYAKCHRYTAQPLIATFLICGTGK